MGSNKPKNNRIDQNASDQHLIDGLDDLKAKLASMLLVGAVVPTNDLVATLQSRIDARKTTESTRASWQTAVKAERDLEDSTKALVSALKQSLLAAFAGDLEALAKFGLTPHRQHVPTPDEKVAAAAKAKATRVARHTMGPKQRASIKGVVPPTIPPTPST